MSLHAGTKAESTHHRLYEFAKAALTRIFVHPYATVCELYCGGGVDAEKGDDAQIGHYIGIDISSSGISQRREAWESQRKAYTADFFELDPCMEDVEMHLKDKANTADLVCCLQNLQMCFQTEERARKLLLNVSSLLKPGGYFFGITPDSSTIWAKYQKNVEAYHNRSGGMKPNIVPNCIRSENYTITFEVEEEKAQFAGMIMNSCSNLVDPRGRLLPRSYDVLGLYTTFIFQKPDPDISPPLMTPVLHDVTYFQDEREWQVPVTTIWRDDEKTVPVELPPGLGKISEQKGILGPGPAELRFFEAL